MSHTTAKRIQQVAGGRHIEWAPALKEYVIWPEGIPASSAREARAIVRRLKAGQPARRPAASE